MHGQKSRNKIACCELFNNSYFHITSLLVSSSDKPNHYIRENLLRRRTLMLVESKSSHVTYFL